MPKLDQSQQGMLLTTALQHHNHTSLSVSKYPFFPLLSFLLHSQWIQCWITCLNHKVCCNTDHSIAAQPPRLLVQILPRYPFHPSSPHLAHLMIQLRLTCPTTLHTHATCVATHTLTIAIQHLCIWSKTFYPFSSEMKTQTND